MTPAHRDGHAIVVVDGSNIATEGRSMPSLTQLNEAVLSFRDEHPDAVITVVVDATFGHRIDKSERGEFDEAVAHNELVAPPAGAIGRGDAFVLSIANKVGATILSNDSFQEFHGDYPWLFDTGRLIGGKPVPNIGWVFVDRVPVKGPVSRKARSVAKRQDGSGSTVRQGSKEASQPMPVPKAPPPGLSRDKPKTAAATDHPPTDKPATDKRATEKRATERTPATAKPAAATPARKAEGRRRGSGGDPGPVNDLLPFLDFVERHPVGSSVTGLVESYSSHGAYVTIGDLRGYVPLRLMGDPPPRSAREVMKVGEAQTLVVVGFTPARRNVDLALPGAAAEPQAATSEEILAAVADTVAVDDVTAPALRTETPPARRRRPRKAAPSEQIPPAEAPAATASPDDGPRVEAPPVKKAPTKRAPAKKAAAPRPATAKSPAVRARATKRVAASAPEGVGEASVPELSDASAATAPARTSPVKKASAKKASAKKPAAKEVAKTAAPVTAEAAPAKKSAAKKSPAAKTVAKTAASKTAATKTVAKKTVAKKTAAKKSVAKKAGPAEPGSAESTAAAPAAPARKRARKKPASS